VYTHTHTHTCTHTPRCATSSPPLPPSLSRERGFSFVRLDGTLAQKRRAQVIQEFQSSAPGSPVVMLLSLKAGGVGLNLTAASHVFLMEPVSAEEK